MGEAVFREGWVSGEHQGGDIKGDSNYSYSPTAAEPTNTHPDYCPARRSRHLISTQITEELSLENKEIRVWSARRISQQTPLPADVTQFGEFLLAHMG